jgi:DNA-binding response OmpR family regulator
MAPKVLIVDDEKGVRDLLEEWLQLAGYETCTASNGHDGLVQLKERQPDLIISDVWMPGMDGYHFCRLARRASKAAIMMITGVPQEAAVLQEMKIGVEAYMVKPLTMKEFLERVDSTLRSGRGVHLNAPASPAPTAADSRQTPAKEPVAPVRDHSSAQEERLLQTYRMLSQSDREVLERVAYGLLLASHNTGRPAADNRVEASARSAAPQRRAQPALAGATASG